MNGRNSRCRAKDLYEMRVRKTAGSELRRLQLTHIGAGKGYHAGFKRNRGRALMWEFEKSFLRRLLSQYQPPRVLIRVFVNEFGGAARI